MARKLGTAEQQLAPPSFLSAGTGWSPSYRCELITPMVGGGTRSWHPDFGNPVRSQSIKGQLRFWWRTMQAFNSAADLKAAEDGLWGSTQQAPRVSIRVEDVSHPSTTELSRKPNRYMDYGNLPDYVLFPFQGQKEENGEYVQQFTLISRISFTLILSGNSLSNDEQTAVENSVKLWVLFGGLGARTRRGCGSIFSQEVMEHFQSSSAIHDFLRSYAPATGPAVGTSPYPSIANCRFGYAETKIEPTSLWSQYMNTYKNIRQGSIGRDPVPAGGNTPGRSRWPEPDTLRHRSGAITGHTPRHPDSWFPRAAFGLPIQTQFNTRKTLADPQGTFTLRPSDHERWPSPMILKVLKINDTTTAKIWLLLNHACPGNLILESTNYWTRSTPPRTVSIPTVELPTAITGKRVLAGSPLPAGTATLGPGTNPYDVLITYLNVPEVP